jgi:hypothetical protein
MRWWAVGLVAAIQGLHAFWILATPAGGRLVPWIGNLLIDASQATAAGLVMAVAVRYWGSRLGLAWSLVGIGLLFGLFAETSWSYQELVMGKEAPFPSVSDVGYVGAYFPVYLGLLLMPQAPASPLGRLKLSVDTLIVMAAVALMSWVLIIEGILAETEGSSLAQALSIFYPFADLGIIFAAFVLVARAGRSRLGAVLTLLAAGYFATVFSDGLYAHLAYAGYETGSYIDIGWVAANTLISLGALTALGHGASLTPMSAERETAPAFLRSLLPYVAVIPLAVLLVLDSRDGGSLVLTGGFVAVLALVILRQVMAIYENVRLNLELSALANMLDYRVKEKTMQLLQRSRPAGEAPVTGERPNGADEAVGGLRAAPGE